MLLLGKEEENKKERRYLPLCTPSLASAHSNPNRAGRSAGRGAGGKVTKSRSLPGTLLVSAPKVPRPGDPLSPGQTRSADHPGQGTPSRARSGHPGRSALLSQRS